MSDQAQPRPPLSTRLIYTTFDHFSESWKRYALLFVVTGLLLTLLSGFFIVKKEEQAVLTRFGKIVNPVVEPGIRYRIPLAEKAHIFPVKRIITRVVSSNASGTDAFTILSGDTNLLEISVSIQYTVSNLRDFLFGFVDPESVLVLITRERLVEEIGSNFIDLIFTSNRRHVEEVLFEQVSERVNQKNIGIQIEALNIVAIRPVEETIAAFRDVNDAIAERAQAESDANRKREHMIARTRGQANALILDAEAKAAGRLAQSKAVAGAYLALLEEYRKRPEQVAITRYWQRMRTTFGEAKVVAVNAGDESIVDINMIDSVAALPMGSTLVAPPTERDFARPPDIESRIVSTSARDPHGEQRTEVTQLTMDGRGHDPSAELDHKSTAVAKSLIFDSSSFFSHGHVKRQGQVYDKLVVSLPDVETLSNNPESIDDKSAFDSTSQSTTRVEISPKTNQETTD